MRVGISNEITHYTFDEFSDTCVLESYGDIDSIDQMIVVKSFVPFDPTNKRTEVTYTDKSTGSIYRVTKGMPEVILGLCNTVQSGSSAIAAQMRSDVSEFARRGFRALAVAIDEHGGNFQLIGLLPVFDPPRRDTAETIKKAIKLGRKFFIFFHEDCVPLLLLLFFFQAFK